MFAFLPGIPGADDLRTLARRVDTARHHGVPDGCVLEHPRSVLLGRTLAADRPLAFRRGPHSEGHRDGRLADAALAGDDYQPLVEKFGYRAIPSNFS